MDALAALSARWKHLPARLRAVLAGASIVALIAVAILELLAHPARVTLFAAPLYPEQVAEVEERLAAWNVAFTPLARNVVVTAGARNALLLKLALAGVPHPHVERSGEALANVGVLTPQSVVDAQARTGLAGDIEAGLRGIAGVDDVQVIVVPSKPAEFADEVARDASASVRLHLRTGVTLPAATVAGIRTYVAASVAGLDPSHVTILDDDGVALGTGSFGRGDVARLRRSLQSALDRAFGAGTTIVRVHAEYAAQRVDVREATRAPLMLVPIARDVRSERYRSRAKSYARRIVMERRGTRTGERESHTPAGALARISTAVFVDRAHAGAIAEIRALAAATVGFDARRGDALVVQAVPFARAPVARRSLGALFYGAVVPLLPALVLATALMLLGRRALPLLGGALSTIVERLTIERTRAVVAGYAPDRLRGVLANEPPHAAAAIISALPAATAAAVLDFYPPHEREAIVRRMQRPHTSFLDEARDLLERHA